MSPLQITSLIVIIYIQSCTSASLTKTIQPNGEIWLQQSGLNLKPSQATVYNTIQLGELMSIEFDFLFHGRSNDPPYRAGYQENFFRIGYDACCTAGCDGEGSAYPGMFLARYSIGDYLDIRVSSGGACGFNNILDNYGILSTTQTHHIKISLNNTQVIVDITGGGKLPYTQTWKREPTPIDYIGDALNVYFLSSTFYSDPFNLGDATFNNIIIKSSMQSTFSPTPTPTLNPVLTPTNNPSKYPSKYPSNNPTIFASKYPSIYPSIIPTVYPIGATLYASNIPSVLPSFTPSKIPTKTPVIDGEINELTTDKNDKLNRTFTDIFTICISIGVFVVSCCMVCGIIILYKKRKFKRQKTTEISCGELQKHNLTINTQTTSRHIQKEKIEIIELNISSYKNSINHLTDLQKPLTPDGDMKMEYPFSYLSAAQKKQLYVTPMQLVELSQKKNDNKNDYLSEAQRKIIMLGTPTDQSKVDNDNDINNTDDDMNVFQTAGYISACSPSVHDENLESPLENKMTIGIVEDISSDTEKEIDIENDGNDTMDNEYEYYYEDDFDNQLTIQ